MTSDWLSRGVCRDEDPDLFFPIGNTGLALLQIEEAKAVCRRCPAMEQCLTWALETNQDAGVWGGLSEDERRAIRRGAGKSPRQDKESMVRSVALARGARIVRLVNAGQTYVALGRVMGLPAHVVRRAHDLVASGEVEPVPEPTLSGART